MLVQAALVVQMVELLLIVYYDGSDNGGSSVRAEPGELEGTA